MRENKKTSSLTAITRKPPVGKGTITLTRNARACRKRICDTRTALLPVNALASVDGPLGLYHRQSVNSLSACLSIPPALITKSAPPSNPGDNNNVYANKWIFEDKLEQNPPRVARIYALTAAVFYDAFIASQDGKFPYWLLRPSQLDPSIVPLFPVPNFPSYPSNHATFSAARSEVLAYLFPTRADFVRALGKEAGDSCIWAGIHYQIDLDSGFAAGRSVAKKFIDWASADGSQ